MTRFLLMLSLTLAGCGGAEAAKLAQARIDTLPNGSIRVISDGPTAWGDSAGVELVETGRFSGEDGSPGELGQPQSIAVDGEGRIYVVDSKPAVIKVFSPEGQLIRTIGREGEGPGEFRIGFIAVQGDRLVLHDPRIGRTSVYDTSGTFLKSWNSSCCYWSDILIDRENRIYIPSIVTDRKPGNEEDTPRGIPYVRWSLEGKVVDTIWVPRRESGKYWSVTAKRGGKAVMSMSTNIPFTPSLLHALHPDGGFVYGWTGGYELVRSTTGPDSARVFGRAWSPEPITDEQRRAQVESRIKEASADYGEATVREAFQLADVPATLPAFGSLRVDPTGRVWAQRYHLADTTRTYFDVFDPAGAYLGLVSAPVRINLWGMQAWTREGVVALIEDDEGRPTVVRLRLGAPKLK